MLSSCSAPNVFTHNRRDNIQTWICNGKQITIEFKFHYFFTGYLTIRASVDWKFKFIPHDSWITLQLKYQICEGAYVSLQASAFADAKIITGEMSAQWYSANVNMYCCKASSSMHQLFGCRKKKYKANQPNAGNITHRRPLTSRKSPGTAATTSTKLTAGPHFTPNESKLYPTYVHCGLELLDQSVWLAIRRHKIEAP